MAAGSCRAPAARATKSHQETRLHRFESRVSDAPWGQERQMRCHRAFSLCLLEKAAALYLGKRSQMWPPLESLKHGSDRGEPVRLADPQQAAHIRWRTHHVRPLAE